MMDENVFLGGCPVIRPEGIYYEGRKVISLGLQGIGVGDVQRANPLPVGRYWVDVFDKDMSAFRAWLEKNKNSVRVETTQSIPGTTHWFEPDEPGRDWYLFDVKSPVAWEGPGLPTIATSDVHTSDDTVQRPEKEKDPLDQIDPKLPQFPEIPWGWVGTAAIIVAAGALVIHFLPKPHEEPSPAPHPEPAPEPLPSDY